MNMVNSVRYNGTVTNVFMDDNKIIEQPIVQVDENEIPAQKHWKKIATYSLSVFGLMLLGHFIFTYIIPIKYGFEINTS